MGTAPENREVRLALETLIRIDRKLDELKVVGATSPSAAAAPQPAAPVAGDDLSREVERIAVKLDSLETVLNRLDSHEKEAASSVAAAASAIRREVNVYLMVIAALAGTAVVLAALAAFR